MSDQLTKVAESEFERGIERYAELLFCEGAEKAVAACLREHPDPTEAYMRLLDLAERSKAGTHLVRQTCPVLVPAVANQ